MSANETSNMIFGYCRCSTDERKQDIKRQVRELKEMGATDDTIYMEYISGTSAKKKELERLLKAIPDGGMIVVTEVSRISRSTKQLLDFIDILKERKLCLQVKDSITIDCRNGASIDPMTNAMLQIAGVFAELERNMINLIKNQGHIYIKGACKISVSGQIIDFSKIKGDMGISSALLDSIDNITVTGNKVITVENLTTFNHLYEENTMIIYLGGYHNTHRRNFIKKLYIQNPNASYYHYGDIDAGGFYILLHLRNKTNVHFLPYHMDINTLQQYSSLTKPLTDNDKKRLQHLLNSEFSEVVQYMLENNCKLEQEALDLT